MRTVSFARWALALAGILSAQAAHAELSRVGGEVRVTNDPSYSFLVDMVWTGAEFGLAWHDNRASSWGEVFFTRLSPTGEKLIGDSQISSVNRPSGYVSVAWTGTEWGFFWHDERNGWPRANMFFARATAAGVRVAVPDVQLTTGNWLGHKNDLVWDGSQYLAVYHEEFDCCSNVNVLRFPAQPSGFAASSQIATPPNAYGQLTSEPAFARGGAGYGVLWSDHVTGDYELYFRPTDANGVPTAATVRVTDSAGESRRPSIAWNGTEYGAVWDDTRDGNAEVYFQRISASGALPAPAVRLTSAAGLSTLPTIAPSAAGWVVSWIDDRTGRAQLYAAHLTGDGERIGADLQVTDTVGMVYDAMVVATGEGEFALAWSDFQNGGAEIYFTRVSATPPDPDADVDGDGVTVGAGDCDDARADVNPTLDERCDAIDNDCDGDIDEGFDADGDGVLSCEGDCDDTRADVHPGAAEPCDGVDNDCDGTTDGGNPGGGAVCDTGVPGACAAGTTACTDGALVCVALLQAGDETCNGVDDDCDGTIDDGFPDANGDGAADCLSSGVLARLGDEVRVTNDPSYSFLVDMVWTGAEFGLAWHDNRASSWGEVFFTRLSPTGEKLIGDSQISSVNRPSGYVSVAWTGTEWGFFWHDERNGWPRANMFFARATAAGVRVAVPDVQLTTGNWLGHKNDLVWDGSQYLAVYHEEFDCCSNVNVLRFPAQPSGFAASSQIATPPNAFGQLTSEPAITRAGAGYGVVWSDHVSGDYEIYFRPTDANGVPTAAKSRITDSAGESRRPSIAWSGSEYAVVWDDARGGAPAIYFQRVAADGSMPAPPVLIASSAATSSGPLVARAASGWIVAWLDTRFGDAELFAAHVSDAGSRVGPELQVSQSSGNVYDATLTAVSGTEFALAWSDFQAGGAEIYFTRLGLADDEIDEDPPSSPLSPGDYLIAKQHRGSADPSALVAIDPVTFAQTLITSGDLLTNPHGVATLPDGTLVVTDQPDNVDPSLGSPEILRVDPATGAQSVLSSGGFLAYPQGIAVLSDGTLLVADAGAGLVKIDPTTGAQSVLSTLQASDVVVDAAGNIYSIACCSPLYIVQVDPLTGALTRASGDYDGGAWPYGLGVDAHGNFYVSEVYYVSGVIKFPAAGSPGFVLASGSAELDPWGLDIDGSGALVIADGHWILDGLVYRMDPNTGSTTHVADMGSARTFNVHVYRGPWDASPPPPVCEPEATAPCYDGPPGTEGVGACTAGARTCNAAGTAYGACVGAVAPVAEECNGLDDNCDGAVDEVPECVIVDTDGDGVADAADNCPLAANADQADGDGDALGDVCDPNPTCGAPVVADTTAPDVLCNAPSKLVTGVPGQAFTATALDGCGVASVTVTDSTCGHCTATLDGATLTIDNTYQNGDSIVWHAVAVDHAGNVTTATCQTVTVGPPVGLVAAYGFDEGAGPTAADASGNGHTATRSGGATWSPLGVFGGAMAFDGVSGLVQAADSSLLHITPSRLTIEAWVFPTTTTGWRSAVMKERADGLGYALYASNGGSTRAAAGYVHRGADVSVGGASAHRLSVDRWSHVAVTYNGAQLRLFFNGVQVASRAVTGALTAAGGPLSIGGNDAWGEFFAGRIDEVRIWDRVRTAAEIVADMNTPISP